MHLTQVFCALSALFTLMVTASITTSKDLEPREPRHRAGAPKCVGTKGVHVISVPGLGQKPGHLDLLQSLTDDVVKSIPGSNYIPLAYPFPQNQTDGVRVTIAGAKILHKYLRNYVQDCPNDKLVLLGYSAGAVIIMNTLCGQSDPYPPTSPLAKSYAPKIIATVVYGDETREPGQSYDKGTCVFGSGKAGRARTATCAPFAPSIASYCDFADGQCCTDGISEENGHFKYPQRYDRRATKFVVKQYKDDKKG